ncbi:MAG: hypothetical protein ACI4QN_02050 [Candidatus Coproplasma sp.]
MRFLQTIFVGENIDKVLHRRERESRKEIYGRLGLWGERAIKHFYYETDTLRARFALEELGINGMHEYGKMIDRLAEELEERITKELLATPQYALNGDDIHDTQIHNAVSSIAEEEIWKQLIRIDYLISE